MDLELSKFEEITKNGIPRWLGSGMCVLEYLYLE